MPEDLPLTKRINVMVGITRSKVITLRMLPQFHTIPLPGDKMERDTFNFNTGKRNMNFARDMSLSLVDGGVQNFQFSLGSVPDSASEGGLEVEFRLSK